MSEWKNELLGTLIISHDSKRSPVKETERVKGSYPYYGASGIIDYVDKYIFDGMKLLVAEDGENLRTRKTPIAFLANGKYWVNNHAHVIEGNEKTDTVFLLYALYVSEISSYLTGSTMPKLTQSNLERIPILLPPLPTQKAIAHVLGTLDDKIELLRQMNETLEEMAKALFKSWFVDFEPVRKKAAGLKTGLPKEIEDLFPSEFEDSELGEIPKGWKVGKLGDDFKIIMGQSPSGETYNEFENGLPFYQGRTDFGFRFPKKRIYCSEPKRIALEGDTLISVRAPVGDQNIAVENCCIGRGVASLKHMTGSISYTYYKIYFLQDQLKAFNGEGTVFGSINQDSLKGLKQLIPSVEEIYKFESVSCKIDSQVLIQEHQITQLSQIRDTLLPKLISGELELTDKMIEKILEEAK
jgi:type I restriction enzyme, S subunit